MGRRIWTLVAVAIWSFIVATTGRASAHPPLFTDADSDERAEELCKQGNALSREGRLAEAVAAYTASFRLRETYAAAANLGTLELKLERYRDAALHLSFALHASPSDAKPPVTAKLKKALADARDHVGALRIRTTPAVVDVAIDGALVHPIDLGHELFVDPGTHVITATCAGHSAARRVVVAKAGDVHDVEIVLVPNGTLQPAAGPSDAVRPPEPQRHLLRPVIVGGAGAATLGAALGISFTVVANGKASSAEILAADLRAKGGATACAHSAGTSVEACGSLRLLLASRSTFSNAAIGSFVVAGGVVAGTGAFAIWSLVHRKSGSVARWYVLPSVEARAAGVIVRRAF